MFLVGVSESIRRKVGKMEFNKIKADKSSLSHQVHVILLTRTDILGSLVILLHYADARVTSNLLLFGKVIR